MANINDISAVITSALNEVSVAGTLDVDMDGKHRVAALGMSGSDDVEITVTVRAAHADTASDVHVIPLPDSL